jgi:hypothetical protein
VVGRAQRTAEANHASGNGWKIDVLEAKQLGSSGYAVQISYSFANRQNVWLRGIGVVSPSGELTYFVRGRALEFRTKKNGAVLANVQIKATVIEQSLPDSERYPPITEGGNVKWSEDSPDLIFHSQLQVIPQQLAEALKELNTLPTPCHQYDEGCLLIPWTRITPPAANIQAQISLQLIFKEAPDHRNVIVKLLYAGQKGYIGGNTWEAGCIDSDAKGADDRSCSGFLRKIRQAVSVPATGSAH